MFDNLLFQTAGGLLAEDIQRDTLPHAVLFSGPASSGKLTCALELARVLSCTGTPKGNWQCGCASCLRHKALVDTSLLIAGPRDCTLEIAAAAKALLEACAARAPYAGAVRYLFVRSVRKLTLRFSQVLWEDDDKVSKIAPVTSAIDELLEELDPARPLPDAETLEKTCAAIRLQCVKLESSFMYDSIPVAQMRRASAWARYRTGTGKKALIVENADRMQESVRNAMLKILEEPPEDTVFILTTSRRGAVMPTILSRVRTYAFVDRTPAQQTEVVKRVFHGAIADGNSATVGSYLQTFLPVAPETASSAGRDFFRTVCAGVLPDIESVVKTCGNFEPRLLLTVFLNGIAGALQKSVSADGLSPENRVRHAAFAAECTAALRECANHITVYNQSASAALELLSADVSLLCRKFGGGLIV